MVFKDCQAKIFSIEEFIMINYVDGKTFRGPYRKAGPAVGPDILMISFDMVPREFYLPREGDLVPHTPNLEDLKKDGPFFSNTYAVSPLCAPSRAAPTWHLPKCRVRYPAARRYSG